MPRGGPRGAMRGGAPRGAMGRGNAPRGGPSGRGGPPAPAANRGGTANRSRPPAAGAPRMLPAAALSHQQVPSASQPRAEAYEDYVRFTLHLICCRHRLWLVLICISILIPGCPRGAICRTFIRGIWKLLQSASSTCVSTFDGSDLVQPCRSFTFSHLTLLAAHSETEYYDYGHGEAQETPYEAYGEIPKYFPIHLTSHCALGANDPACWEAVYHRHLFIPFIHSGQEDWDNSWANSGAGGKAQAARQTKGAYREHPYGRYWTASGRELFRQLSQIVTLWATQK